MDQLLDEKKHWKVDYHRDNDSTELNATDEKVLKMKNQIKKEFFPLLVGSGMLNHWKFPKNALKIEFDYILSVYNARIMFLEFGDEYLKEGDPTL